MEKVRKHCAKCGWVGPARPRQRRCYLAKAEKHLKRAREKVTEVGRKIARATTSLRMWERRASYYAAQASKTDAELAQEKADRKAQAEARAARRIKRGMKVGGAA